MSMQHFADLTLTISAEREIKDYTSIIEEAFMGNRKETCGSFNGEIQWDGISIYHISYFDSPYYEGNEIEEYLTLLAKQIPYCLFSLEGSINNEGSGGDYVDKVSAKYLFGELDYEYYCGYGGRRSYPTIFKTSRVLEFDPDSAKRMGGSFADKFTIEEGVLKKYEGPGGAVVVPDGATSIGDSAFRGCKGLTSITLPSGLNSIGHSAFEWCSGLTSITLPDSLTSIGWSAFENCTGLTSITLSNNLTSISNKAFKGCSAIEKITIPESVKSIEYAAFEGCSSLKSMTLPSGLTSISSEAFKDCTNLMTIKIPESVTSLGFSVSYGATVTGKTLFSGASHMRDVSLPPAIMEQCINYPAKELRMFVLTTDVWPVLIPAQQAELFLERYRESFSDSFKTCIPDDQVDSLGEAIITKLMQDVSGKQCTAAAGFVKLYSKKAQVSILKKLYQELKTKKAGKKAVATIEEDSELQALVSE